MTPAIIFGSLNLATSIAAYFGLIESVSGNVQKLLHQAFKSAIQNLQYAITASSNVSRLDYLKTAKDRFIDAISVEENENLISSYIGLAMCQHLLGDTSNRDMTMRKINNVKLTLSEKTKAIAKNAFDFTGAGGLTFTAKMLGRRLKGDNNMNLDDYFSERSLSSRIEKFNAYKQLALATK